MFDLQVPAGRLESLAFSPDGRRLAVASREGAVWCFDLATRELAASREYAPLLWLTWALGSKVIVLRGFESLALWDPSSGGDRGLDVLESPSATVSRMNLGYRVEGTALTLAFVRPGHPGWVVEALTWDLQKRERIRTAERGLQHWIMAAALPGACAGPIALAGAPTLTLWDDRTGAVQEVTLPDRVKARVMQYAPDGQTLAILGDAAVWFFDMPTTRVRSRVHAGYDISDMVFSPDGQTLATALYDGRVILWDVRTCREKAVYDWGLGRAWAVEFAADGMTMAAAGTGRVVVWDVDQG